MSLQTPYSAQLEEGNYQIDFPTSVTEETSGQEYIFQQWEDGSTSASRVISLTGPTTLAATYVIPPTPTHLLSIDTSPPLVISFTLTPV